jgi:hypothetical protein
MTRRLDPMDRIRELSDASAPFNFDVHALLFSKDAVGIESAMHDRLATARVNGINQRREFFHVTAAEAKTHLTDLAGELLQFNEIAEALEYRQTLRLAENAGRGINRLQETPQGNILVRGRASISRASPRNSRSISMVATRKSAPACAFPPRSRRVIGA